MYREPARLSCSATAVITPRLPGVVVRCTKRGAQNPSGSSLSRQAWCERQPKGITNGAEGLKVDLGECGAGHEMVVRGDEIERRLGL